MKAGLQLSRLENRADPVPRPQRNRRQRHHRMPFHQTKAVTLRHRRQHQRRFHQRKRIPDALPRPA